MEETNVYKRVYHEIPKFEGEFIQDIYCMFRSFKVGEGLSEVDTHEGIPVPSLEEISEMQDLLKEMILARAKGKPSGKPFLHRKLK